MGGSCGLSCSKLNLQTGFIITDYTPPLVQHLPMISKDLKNMYYFCIFMYYVKSHMQVNIFKLGSKARHTNKVKVFLL